MKEFGFSFANGIATESGEVPDEGDAVVTRGDRRHAVDRVR